MGKKAKWIVAFVLTVVLAFALLSGLLPSGGGIVSDPARAAHAETVDHVPYEVLAPADSLEHAQEIAQAYGLQLKSYAYGIAVFIAPDAEEAVELSEQMQQDGIPPLSLNLVYTCDTSARETQTRYDSTYQTGRRYEDFGKRYEDEDLPSSHVSDTQTVTGTGAQWHHNEMDTELAWAEEITGEGVLVAVLDTGINSSNPAFEGQLSALAYNAETNEVGLEYVQDDNGHGTHVSGIIAASYSDGDTSVYGVAPDAEIMMIKVGDFLIDGAAVFRGVNYAIENGADVINMSFGRRNADGAGFDSLEHSVISKAVNSGVTVVCAAGNYNASHADYPAAYEEVIAVAATRQGYQFEDGYSNYGPEIDIAAPGSDIYSTNAPDSGIAFEAGNHSDFIELSGTSMASPNVAGVAALIISANPGCSPDEVRAILCETARDVDEVGWDELYGAGIVNAYAAVLGPDALQTVTYDFNDGSREPVTVKVIPGYTLFEPANPQWEGHAFDAWYVDETDDVFDFDEPVEEDITLYAQWIDAEPGMYVLEFPDANFRRVVLRIVNEQGGAIRSESSFVSEDVDVLAATTELFVANMRISDLTGLQHFTGLSFLACYNNRLTELDLSKNTELVLLDCDGNRIIQLDLSKNTSLEYLYCAGNLLAELDVSQNTKLAALNCHWNALTALDVSKCTMLTTLRCNDNLLTALDVSNNTELEMLNCSYNQLAALDVTKNTKLSGENALVYDEDGAVLSFDDYVVGLDCSGNLLTTLDISKNTELVTFACNESQLTELDTSNNLALALLLIYDNQLTELDVSGNAELRILDCGANWMETLNVAQNTKLSQLWCFGGDLVSVDVSNNTALEVLICGENRLMALDISQNTALTELNCSYNFLSELDVSDNGNLGFLICYYNYMESTDKVMGWELIPGLILDYTFQFNPQYTGNPPTGADITSAFKDPEFLAAVRDLIGKPEGPIFDYDVAQVTDLNLSGWGTPYNISDLSGIEYFCALQYLNCEQQPLGQLDVSQNTMLAGLSCSDTNLTELDVSNNLLLESLSCGGNNLDTLDVSGNEALMYLYCSGNNLTTLDVSNNRALEDLFCAGNHLEALDVSNNSNLKHLDCSSNYMKSIYDVIGWQELGLILNDTFFYYDQNVAQDLEIIITVNPTDTTVLKGDTTQYLEVLAGTTMPEIELEYQWYSNTVAENSGGTLIEGATSATLTIPAQETGTLYYYCVVSTSVDGVSSVVSKVAAVEVVEAWLDGMFAVEFPDAKLCSKVLQLLNVDGQNRTGSSVMTSSDKNKLSEIVELNVSNKSISDMTGLQWFPNLLLLHCNNNQLTELDLSGNTMLRFVDCGGNRLNTLDVSNNTELEILYCYDNALTALDVSNNSTLRMLVCNDNYMQSPDDVIGWQEQGLVLGESFIFHFQKNTPVPVISITTQPAGTVTVPKGSSTDLSVIVDNPDEFALRYQWYRCASDDYSGAEEIDGATSATYAIPDTLDIGTYYYCCLVSTFWNDFGSEIITVEVVAPALEGIEVTTMPDKTSYTVNDTLDLSGLVVTATYTDGSTAVINTYTTTPSENTVLSAAGMQTVEISYTEDGVTKTTSFSVAVDVEPIVLVSIAATNLPSKIAYNEGDTLDLSGLVIMATYSDGNTAVITDYTTDPENGTILNTVGDQSITVSYTENTVTKTTSFTIMVEAVPVVVESIVITNPATKVVYKVGDTLSFAGLTVTATYSDGSSKAVTNFTANPATGTVLDTVGPLTVNISYTEDGVTHTTSFTIIVNAVPIVYNVVEGFKPYAGSGDNTAKIDADDNKFVRLTLNGKVVDPSNYTIASGSTVITLKESYLKTFANGIYIFRAEFTDGYVDVMLTVNKGSTISTQTSDVPKTGDDANRNLWLGVSTLAFAAMIGGLAYGRKRKTAQMHTK